MDITLKANKKTKTVLTKYTVLSQLLLQLNIGPYIRKNFFPERAVRN